MQYQSGSDVVFDAVSPAKYRSGMGKLTELREKAGLTGADLARLAHTSQPQIFRLEAWPDPKGRRMTKEWAERLAPHLGVAPAELLFDETPATSGFRPPPEILGARDLPIYAAVEGGPGEMVVLTDPVEIVPRPWYMREVRDGYGVLVIGESMAPAFRPGDMAIINPRLPVIRDKHAIFVSGEAQGEFKATIKLLIGSTAELWRVEQYNPPKGDKPQFTLAKKLWPKALRVVGKYEGG